jgi:glucose/arabinose dehydrogenase
MKAQRYTMSRLIFSLVLLVSAATAALAQNLRSQVYATGFTWPIAMIQDPTDPDVQFVVQQRGLIRVVVNGVVQGTNFLDLSGVVHQTNSEGGLLGLAFHPDYAANRFLYVYYTDTSGDTRIVRFTRNAVNPLMADSGSAQQVIFIDQPFSNHNGGTIRFGPNDGYLYVGMGDGGSGNDPGNRAQTITNMLLGKVLRLDVDTDDFPADSNKNYGIPPTNPFVGVAGDDEIWSFGLRNPWKWSFDNPSLLGTGGMLIGDVGQNNWEEIDYEPPLASGRNYGWREYEGNHLTGNGGGVGPPYFFPIHEYSHALGISVTGGYAYRGLELGDYFGKYFFADYGSARIWSLDLVIAANGEGSAANVTEVTTDIASGAALISSIDVDSEGELYFVDYRGGGAGRVIRLLPENRVWATSIQPLFSTPITGNIRALSSGDTKLLVTGTATIPQIGWGYRSMFLLNMQTDMAAPSFFDVFVDVGSSQVFNPGGLELSMMNWNTGMFESVGMGAITTNIETRQFLNIPAANYRRASDGAVQMEVKAATTGPLFFANTQVRYDRIKVVAR